MFSAAVKMQKMFFKVTGLHGCTFIDKTREPPNTYQVRTGANVKNSQSQRVNQSCSEQNFLTSSAGRD
jgi:hypothetical protein